MVVMQGQQFKLEAYVLYLASCEVVLRGPMVETKGLEFEYEIV